MEFVDTNVLIYAHDGGAGKKQDRAIELIARLNAAANGATSIQVLAEFYAVATRKLGMASAIAEEVVGDFAVWTIHRPSHDDLLRAIRLQRRYRLGWWDAFLVNSALELNCGVLWSEDFSDGQRYATLRAHNPFV